MKYYLKLGNYHLLLCMAGIFGIAYLGNLNPVYASDGIFSVEISVRNEPISEVLKQIRAQTGYEVEINFIDKSHRISGIYKNTPVEILFTSIFSQYNIAVTVDKDKKVFTVSSLGIKGEQKVPMSAVDTSANVTDTVLEENGQEQLTDTSIPTIDAMPSQEVSEVEQQHIDPLTNLPVKDLEAMHTEQVKEFENNAKAFDPLFSSVENGDLD